MMTQMILMLLPNGEVLKHEDAPYDPVKAHEYYIRTRHLKGRRKGSDYTVTTEYGRSETLTPQQLVEQRAYASHRVNVITNRLTDLKTQLAAAVAKAAKGPKTPQPKTAAEKLKAANTAKTKRQEHQQQLKNKAKTASAKKAATTTTKKTSTGTDINSLQDRIAVTHQNLLDAVAKQRRLAAAKKIG